MTKSRYNPARDRLERFESPEAYLAWVNTLPANMRTHDVDNGHRDAWYGHHTGASALRALEFGDTKYLPQAEALLEKMRESGLLSDTVKIWDAGVVGAYPHVPNFLAGQPDTMFARVDTDMPSDVSPISLYVCNNASAGVPASQLVDRGVAIMGLALALKQSRPVDLYVYSINDVKSRGEAHGTCVRIETNPMDLDRATFMVCDPGFFRMIQFASSNHVAGRNNTRSSLPQAWGGLPDADPVALASVRAMLGCASHDVVIPGCYLTDVRFRTDPIGWIKEHLEAIKLAALG